MRAAYVESLDRADPLNCLVIGERPEPEITPGWERVRIKAAGLNHHDLWSLRGVGISHRVLPMILGCDAAGIDETGREVIVYPVISTADWVGDETLDPQRSILSERYQGTLAEEIVVPRRNLVQKPKSLSFAEAACLPSAWLTAYRMLFTQAGLKPGDSVLVQGAGGGVSTALVTLARAAGIWVVATSRNPEKRAKALELGAHEVYRPKTELPQQVDAVMESVGEATWSHSISSLRPGGTLVTTGATSGTNLEDAELSRLIHRQHRVIGSTMGTRAELESLVVMLHATHARPVIDEVLGIDRAREGFEALASGNVFGKIVVLP